MINGHLIIDAVAHPYNLDLSNRQDNITDERFSGLVDFMYRVGHRPLESKEPGFLMTIQEFQAKWDPWDLCHAFFVESDVDVVVPHGVEIAGYAKKGGFSYWPTIVAMKKIAPERVYMYGAVDPFGHDLSATLADMEEKAAAGCVGYKFYPSNGLFEHECNHQVQLLFSDPTRAYPLFEKARSLGVKHIAVHKTQPVGVGPLDAVHGEDVSSAAAMFPDLTFEIVHAGWAFLEETALQLMVHPNIYANLEGSAGMVVNQPLQFAHMLGTFLKVCKPEQLLFASGCALAHPDPVVRGIMAFQMPQALVDGYGYPQITDEMKLGWLGGNMANLLGIDPQAKLKALANDEWSQMRSHGKAAPWSAYRARRAGKPMNTKA